MNKYKLASRSLSLSFSGVCPLVWGSTDEAVGSLNPRAVIGSVGDSWMVRGFVKLVREVDDEKIDWSRCR